MSALPTDPWPVTWVCSEVDTASPAATGIAATAATQVLHALTGGQFGLRSVTLRPCRRGCAGIPTVANADLYLGSTYIGGAYGYPWPALVGGVWMNLGCGICGADACPCAGLEEAELPAGVYDITQVKVDGATLASSVWRLDRVPSAAGDVLVRLDGQQWPLCQQLANPDTLTGTWSVTARYGSPVPQLASLAVGELACEFLKGMDGQDCRLPKEVVSLARQGVTLQFPTVTEFTQGGMLGLPVCDRLLLAVNPKGLRRRARTWSPDRLGLRQVGT
jgi:hypothetical protein